jgi:hypothetical protein
MSSPPFRSPADLRRLRRIVLEFRLHSGKCGEADARRTSPSLLDRTSSRGRGSLRPLQRERSSTFSMASSGDGRISTESDEPAM